MTLRLPEDILKEIFENFEDETGSLFSSLLVNRLWCLNVIPILWKNPLKNQFKKASENLLTCQHRCTLLLRTLLSCLSDESRGLLSENRLELPFQISQRALFDYPMHCKNLRTSDVSMLVWSAVERKQISDQRGKFLFFVLEQELYKLFFSRSSAIQQFTLCSMLHSIQLFSGATSSLANLSVLRCSTESHESFFFGLAQICERIKVIIVDFCDKDNDGLNFLICVQNGVNCFECKHGSIHGQEDQCPNLNIALQTQAHSLKKLDIIDNMGGILLNTICSFSNLRCLKFAISDGTSDVVINNLRNAEIPNLETLEVRGEPISVNILSSLIKNTRGNFQKLHLCGWRPSVDDNLGILLPIMRKHCPRLRSLSTWIGEDDLINLELLLSSCRELESIFLRVYSNELMSRYGIFNLLKRINPKNLRKLKLEHLFLLDEEEGLEMFLKSRSIKMPLILEIVGNLISQDSSEIISTYRFNGVLKDAKLLCFGEDSAPDQQTPHWKID
ncbi:31146_t:CDS:1, partial [Racocetra persica]